MADKSSRGLSPDVANSFSNLNPSEAPRPRRMFNPIQETGEPATPEKPVNKGGRPKGIPKTKKTFYLATDLSNIRRTQINLARNAGIFVKDESDLVDLALEVLTVIAANAEYTALIDKVDKKRTKQ